MTNQLRNPDEAKGLAENIGFLLGHASLLKDRILDRHLAQEDITASQAKVLFYIYMFDISRPCEMVKTLGVDGSAVTRMLDRLEKKDLIAREIDPSDRRSQRVVLTEKGEATIKKARPLALVGLDELTSSLTDTEVSQLKSALKKILSAYDLLPSTEPVSK